MEQKLTVRIQYTRLIFWGYLCAFVILWYFPFQPTLLYLFEIGCFTLTLILSIWLPSIIYTTLLIFGLLPGLLNGALYNYVVPHYELHPLLMLGLAAVGGLWWSFRRKVRFNPVLVLAALFGLYISLSVLYADHTEVYDLYFFAGAAMYICLPILVHDRQDVKITWLSFILCGILFVGFTVPRTLGGITFYTDHVLNDRNYMSLHVEIFLMITVLYMMRYRRELRTLQWVGFGIVILGEVYMIASFASRTAMITLLLFTVLLCAFHMKRDIKRAVLLVLLSCIALYVVYLSGMMDYLLERFQEDDMRSANGRVEIQKGFLEVFSQEPMAERLFGRGEKSIKVLHMHAHNAYLQVLVDYGLLGCCLYCLLLLAILWYLRRTDYPVLVCPLMTLMVYQLVLHTETDAMTTVFLMHLASVGACRELKANCFRVRMDPLTAGEPRLLSKPAEKRKVV